MFTELKDHHTTTALPGRPSDFNDLMDFVCPAALQVPPEYEYSLSFGAAGRHDGGGKAGSIAGRHVVEDCGAPCSEKLFFGLPNVYQMRLWVGIWAVVCLASTLFTLLTFLVRNPVVFEKLIYLSLMVVLKENSIIYIIFSIIF